MKLNILCFFFVFAFVLILKDAEIDAVKCYQQYCRCKGGDEDHDEQMKRLDKDCSCDVDGAGEVGDCGEDNEQYLAGCIERSDHNTTGQVKSRDCGDILKSDPNAKFGCEKDPTKGEDAVICICQGDLCNNQFSNSFQAYHKTEAFQRNKANMA